MYGQIAGRCTIPKARVINKLNGELLPSFDYNKVCQTIDEIKEKIKFTKTEENFLPEIGQAINALNIYIFSVDAKKWLSHGNIPGNINIMIPIDPFLISKGFELKYNTGDINIKEILTLPFYIGFRNKAELEAIDERYWEIIDCVLNIYRSLFFIDKSLIGTVYHYKDTDNTFDLPWEQDL